MINVMAPHKTTKCKLAKNIAVLKRAMDNFMKVYNNVVVEVVQCFVIEVYDRSLITSLIY
jgi:hypothetical protein